MNHVELEYNGLHFVLDRHDKQIGIDVFNDRKERVGRCRAFVEDCSFNGTTVKAMVIGCLLTRVECRRLGIARKTFEMLDPYIREMGVLISYLHPFAFPYYRMMGYERVSDHRVLEFAIGDLDFLPRYPNLEKVNAEDDLSVLDAVYNEFSRGRNVMLRRYGSVATQEAAVVPTYMDGGPYSYSFKGNKLHYLSRDEQGRPDGYLSYRREMPLQDHYLKNGVMHIDEMCFTTPAALRKLLGFVRMYDGELERVRIANCGMAPEVERVLRKYKFTDIKLLPDISARCHDVGGVLAASTYPREPGRFTVRVNDCPKSPFSQDRTQGVWQVVYGNGTARVTRLAETAACDLTLDMPAFSQFVHGFENYGADVARYMEGVQLHGDACDFFRAFPNRPAGAFELY